MKRIIFVITMAALFSGAADFSNAAQLTPPLPDLTGIVKDMNWAIVLGKALFWDQQVGSDGIACASCHFSAGADSRIRNALTPGFPKKPDGDTAFGAITNFDGESLQGVLPGVTGSGAIPDSAYELKPQDFPTYHLSDYKDRNSVILLATDDAVSSSGSFDAAFGRVGFPRFPDKCFEADGEIFHAGSYPARQVEPRNTPTTINAAFNLFNFWDGRANRIFNGVGVFGPRDIAGDPRKRLIVLNAQGDPKTGYLALENAGLASQAVGPPLSEKEMACEGRDFQEVGRRMILRVPLALQKTHVNDSVFGKNGPFGDLRNKAGKGLQAKHIYANLIMKAFDERYWKAHGFFNIDQIGNLRTASVLTGYSQLEHNFSMFWGISIMLYEATLVSDRSKFDTWFASCNPRVTNPDGAGSLAVPIANPIVDCRKPPADPTAAEHGGLTAQEVLGFGLFNNGGVGIRNPGSPACSGCHPVTNPNAVPLVLPLFSEAQFESGQTFVPVERSRIDDRGPGTTNDPPATTEGAVHDRGFFNIGVSPASFDPGNGGSDPYGNPLSAARMFLAEQSGKSVVDPSGITDPCNTRTLIEGGFGAAFNGGRYPGCDANLTDTSDRIDPGFNWSQERELVDGGFKTPSVRNVGLTPPYFHSGAYGSLRQVVEFYARGGSRRDKSKVNPSYTGDTSGTGSLGKRPIPVAPPDFGTNVDFFIRDIKSTEEQIDAMVAFMLTLTDRRVQCDQAPFDHPELYVFNGHPAADLNGDGRADDIIAVVPATGAGGYEADGRVNLCLPNTGDLFNPDLRNRLTTP